VRERGEEVGIVGSKGIKVFTYDQNRKSYGSHIRITNGHLQSRQKGGGRCVFAVEGDQ